MTDSATLFSRHPGNPLLSPERWPYSINAVMNAGATRVGDETLLLCRVEDRRGFSHLTCARSRDGASNWVVDEHPSMSYDGTCPEEEWGLEDPRVTYVEELGRWIIAYTAFGRGGPGVSLAQTEDFKTLRAARRRDGARGQERGAAAAAHRRQVGALPPAARRRVALALDRLRALERAGARAAAAARAAGGTPRGSGWARPRSRPSTAGSSSTTASARRSRAVSTAPAWRCSTSSSPPSCCAARRSGCSARAWTTRSRATSRTSSSPAASSTIPTRDKLFLYYGAADTRIGLATASRADVLEYLLACPPG